MKENDDLTICLDSLELTHLEEDELILLTGGSGDIAISGNNVGNCKTTNNCNGGNCVTGCGSGR